MGIKTSPGNYRPISILPVITKIFIVNTRLMKFIESNHILGEHQYGFRHGYSTKLSLINLTNQITKIRVESLPVYSLILPKFLTRLIILLYY